MASGSADRNRKRFESAKAEISSRTIKNGKANSAKLSALKERASSEPRGSGRKNRQSFETLKGRVAQGH
jgi:hypothetical protein